jgi:hypothetical protein
MPLLICPHLSGGIPGCEPCWFPAAIRLLLRTMSQGRRRAFCPNASLHRNLEGRLSRGSSAVKGFQLSLIAPFEVSV